MLNEELINFHSWKTKYYGSHWVPLTIWAPMIFKISSFMFTTWEWENDDEFLDDLFL